VPFIGVLPERESLFRPQPRRVVAVSDAAAWRLNPVHRGVYDKLALALAEGLLAAPCGVSPLAFGLAPETPVFVKPIVNLAGMALEAGVSRADAVPVRPGSFWCERLEGEQTSSDLLLESGHIRWQAHTRAGQWRDQGRPCVWEVGVAIPEIEPELAQLVDRHLADYTGLCNIELIGGRPVEIHLRGSNGFFDLYGPGFVPAWVALVDGAPFVPPPPVPGGMVISVFGRRALSGEESEALAALGVSVSEDRHTPDRVAILRATDRAVGRAALALLERRRG